ncbi:MAG: hypothetical protein ACOCP8_06275 [archaeon]
MKKINFNYKELHNTHLFYIFGQHRYMLENYRFEAIVNILNIDKLIIEKKIKELNGRINGNIYFKNKENVMRFIEWAESILVVNQLSNKNEDNITLNFNNRSSIKFRNNRNMEINGRNITFK